MEPAFSKKRRAATIGPMVWELDGPIPILNNSNTERNIGVLPVRATLAFDTGIVCG
jgi:hypothetical protein